MRALETRTIWAKSCVSCVGMSSLVKKKHDTVCPFLTLVAKLSAFKYWCQIVRCQIVWRQIVLQSSNLDHPRTQTHDPISPDQLQCELDCCAPVGNQRGRCELGWDELRDWEPVGDMAFVYNSLIVQCKTKIKMYKKIARASLFFHLPLIIYYH